VRYSTVGPVVRLLCCFSVSVMYMFWRFLEWFYPRHEIEPARDFPTLTFRKSPAGSFRMYEIDLGEAGKRRRRKGAGEGGGEAGKGSRGRKGSGQKGVEGVRSPNAASPGARRGSSNGGRTASLGVA
jgi:hypothetical protein